MELQSIDYGRTFPWVHLFRGFRIALDLRKMLLAGLALVLLAAGEWAFSIFPFAVETDAAVPAPDWPWHAGSRYGLPRPAASGLEGSPTGVGPAAPLLDRPLETLAVWAAQWDLVLRPARTLVDPAAVLFRTGLSWSDVAYAWTRLLWALCVWALFAGAITRMAAVQFARDQRVGLRAALGFSARKFLSFVCAPLLPLAGIGVLWTLCLLGGLVGRIPEAGGAIVGALWGLPLLLGFLMTLILIGVAVGWPLMYATISAEGSDAFDGFSRSYSYVYSRPWHYLWYALVALVYGSILIVFVSLAAWLVAHLAAWAVASGMGPERVAALHARSADFVAAPALPAAAADSMPLGSRLTSGWLGALSLLLSGFVYSYFWSAATIIYFLLRRTEDATDLGEVYLPEGSEPDPLLPLVGVAASDQPVIERPIRPPAPAPASGPPEPRE